MNQNESGWQLSGNSFEAYERYMVPAHCLGRARDLIERVGLRSGESVLDVACGTGVVARAAHERIGHTGRVTAMDLNPGMLDVARRVASFLEPPIEFFEGSAEKIPLPDAALDVVLCQQALQFMPNQVAALKEMRRVLRAHGRLAFNVWRSAKFNLAYDVLADALSKHVSQDAGKIMRTPFTAKSVEHVRSWLVDAGFENGHVAIRFETVRFPSFDEFVRREIECMPVPNVQTAMERNRGAIVGDVAKKMADYVDDYGLVCHVEDYVAVAIR